jgi:hypothetical protein
MAQPPQLLCRRVQHCHSLVSRMQVHLKSIVITWSSSPSHGVGPTTASPGGGCWRSSAAATLQTCRVGIRQIVVSRENGHDPAVIQEDPSAPASRVGPESGLRPTRGRRRCALAPTREGYSQTISVEVANTCLDPRERACYRSGVAAETGKVGVLEWSRGLTPGKTLRQVSMARGCP